MNSTFDEDGRRELLVMDRFFIANQPAFRKAWVKLFAAVPCAPEELGGLLSLYEYAILSGEWLDRSILETIPLLERIPLLICYRHLSAGEPLYIDGALVVLWKAWEMLPGGGSVLACRSCGYRYPSLPGSPISQCSLCKGVLGDVGCWQGGKVGAAWVN